MNVTIGELKQGLALVQASVTAINAGLTDVPDDEAVVMAALQLAISIDPALLPVGIILPLAMDAAVWVIKHNTQGRAGSQTPAPKSGQRGS